MNSSKHKTRLTWWSARGWGLLLRVGWLGDLPDGCEVESPHSDLGGTTVEVGESIVGVDSSSRTPQWRTLELVAWIGRRPMRVLVDSGSTGNYIDARECATQRIKIEARRSGERAQDGRWYCGQNLRDEFSSCSNVVGIEVKFPPGYFPI